MGFPRLSAGAGADQELRALSRFGLITLLVMVFGFFGFLLVMPIEGAVVAAGVVKVDLNRKVVQHQEGGTVKAVRVRDGERVQAGQVLIELADVAVAAGADLLRNQYDAELARTVRLTAEKLLAPRVTFPEELTRRGDQPGMREILERERVLFTARRGTLESQIALLKRQIGDVHSEIAALERQIEGDRSAIALQKEELAVNQKLVEQQFIQRTRIIGLERAVADYVTRLGEHEADLARSRQKINDLQLRIVAQQNEYVEGAARELRESGNNLLDVEQRLRPSEDAALRQAILAPVTGEVVGLKVFSAGSVIGPRDVLMEIVPRDAHLVVEARMRPEDITHVRGGALADVRLTAFRYRDTPVAPGRVTHVSADVFTEPQNGASYYTVLIEVTREELARAGNLYLQAGMPAEVYVKTARRSIATYLFEPVTSFLFRAMREH
ncbi:MAG: HlyD family type I secretion periplasmic adaptor subunit [Betaproteobacteria bacterium]|nr:HlyD family type I secretion periplasmic adaptor subunit [Betaproteobacteria bacterium]